MLILDTDTCDQEQQIPDSFKNPELCHWGHTNHDRITRLPGQAGIYALTKSQKLRRQMCRVAMTAHFVNKRDITCVTFDWSDGEEGEKKQEVVTRRHSRTDLTVCTTSPCCHGIFRIQTWSLPVDILGQFKCLT